MSKNMFLLFSHRLTQKQIEESRDKLEVTEYIYLPEDLKNLWSHINPTGDLEIEYFKDIITFIKDNGKKGDIALVQGDFGATYIMVNWCIENGFIPIYSTTERVYSLEKSVDGKTINRHIFEHVRFRRYSCAK